MAYRARVSSLGRDRAELAIEGSVGPGRATTSSLTLATAVPKGERFDWLVEKATELGVARLIPLVTERSVVDPRSAKLDRLRRVIVEASKQCRRDRLMGLEAPTPWDSLVGAAANRAAGSPIRAVERSARRDRVRAPPSWRSARKGILGRGSRPGGRGRLGQGRGSARPS